MATEAVQVIQDLAVVLLAALMMAALFHRLRQPVLVGYILAGIIIGPYTPPFGFLLQPNVLDLFAQVGLVFLLLAVGLDYPVARLRLVARPAFVVALTETAATFAAGYLVARLLGFAPFDCLFLGLAISVSSTVILAKLLETMGVLAEGTAGLVLGITVIEDVVIVSALGVLQSIASTGGLAPLAVVLAIGLVVLFIALTLLLGRRIVPGLVDLLAAQDREELLLLTVLGVTFGLSILSSLIGISVATGAFLAGVLVAEARAQPKVRALVGPIKELFAAIFFVAIGALIDVGLIPGLVAAIAALLLASVAVKALATYLAARAARLGDTEARRAALTLAGPRGELSLVVAKGGEDVHATSPEVLPVVGALTLISAILSPYLVALAWRRRPGPASDEPAAVAHGAAEV